MNYFLRASGSTVGYKADTTQVTVDTTAYTADITIIPKKEVVYKLTGKDVSFKKALRLTAQNGTFTLSGITAILKKSIQINAGIGAFGLTAGYATLLT